MTASAYGLMLVRPGADGPPVVVLHGIRQTRDQLRPFAEALAHDAPGRPVYVYGYDHTRGLEDNGRRLAEVLDADLPHGRIDLVGYSMGGLVARLAATEAYPSRIHTVVTVATPNRGALSNRELTTLGQLGRKAFEWLSPMAPRTEGVKDLTRADDIMKARRARLVADHPNAGYAPDARRYASIPAIFYATNKADFEFGPSLETSGLQAVLLFGVKKRLSSMPRPHDGIVTEASCDLSKVTSEDWAEIRLMRRDDNAPPALCHAVHVVCTEADHISILKHEPVARLAARLVATDDWRTVRRDDPDLLANASLAPFDT